MKKKRPLYWNSFSIFPVSISTISRQSARHSAPVYRISSTWTDYGRKMTSCRFSKWRLSAILTFRGPIMGSLKSPCRPSYTSSRDTIALNCFFFEKIVFFMYAFLATYDNVADCMPLSSVLKSVKFSNTF